MNGFLHIRGFDTRAGNSGGAQPKWLIMSRLVVGGGAAVVWSGSGGVREVGEGAGTSRRRPIFVFGKLNFQVLENPREKTPRKKCHFGILRYKKFHLGFALPGLWSGLDLPGDASACLRSGK